MTLATSQQNKEIYSGHHDEIIAKRLESPWKIRRHAHLKQYHAFLEDVPSGATVLDAGCGEGVLSVLLAKHGCTVTGVDISEPNIEAAKKYAEQEGVADKVTFLVGDAEQLPADDKSFEYVVSSHVLEHLPDFQQGVRELHRVAAKKVVAAIPTCLSPCAWTLLGGDNYWVISRKSLYALPVGICRVLWALLTGKEGVNEGYAGRSDLVHIWRFPWVGQQLFEKEGLIVESYRSSAIIFPYFSFLLPLSCLLEKGARWPLLRAMGYGTTYVCRPSDQ